MITNEWSTLIENFMIPGAGVLVLGRGHIYLFKNGNVDVNI